MEGPTTMETSDHSTDQGLLEYFDGLEVPAEENKGVQQPLPPLQETQQSSAPLQSMFNLHRILGTVQDQIGSAIEGQTQLSKEISGPHGLHERLDMMAEEVSDGTHSITESLGKQESMETKLNLLTDVVIRQGELIKQLQSQVLDLKCRSMRQNLLLHGIPESPKENPRQIVENVLSKSLGVPNPWNLLDICHRMGAPRTSSGNPRPIVVRFIARNDAEKVLDTFRDWQRERKGTQSKLWITPQYPEEVVERRRQLAEVSKKFKAKNPDAKCKMNMGDLYVQGEKYRDPVVPPSARDLLTCTPSEAKDLKTLKLTTSPPCVEKGSSFVAQGKNIKSVNEVRNVYKKVFSTHPTSSASHNILVYSLPDGTVGSQDDGETGAGRFLTRWLKRRGVKGVAIVVTRIYGGTHLGLRRFELAKQCAECVLDQISGDSNTPSGTNDSFK